ncbi:MAG: hypothetical protein R3359_12220 [Marinirhabdus sp.]|nr:hypothetical protein [Marinirhabdus sp.]
MKHLIFCSLLLIPILMLQSCCDWCGEEPEPTSCEDYPDYEGAERNFVLNIHLDDTTQSKSDLQTIYVAPMLKNSTFGDMKGVMAIGAHLDAASQNDSTYFDIKVSNITVRRLGGQNYDIDALQFYPPTDTKSGTPVLLIKMNESNSDVDQTNSQMSITIPELLKGDILDVITTTEALPPDLQNAIFTRICQDRIY